MFTGRNDKECQPGGRHDHRRRQCANLGAPATGDDRLAIPRAHAATRRAIIERARNTRFARVVIILISLDAPRTPPPARRSPGGGYQLGFPRDSTRCAVSRKIPQNLGARRHGVVYILHAVARARRMKRFSGYSFSVARRDSEGKHARAR